MRKGNQYWIDCGFKSVYKNKKLDIIELAGIDPVLNGIDFTPYVELCKKDKLFVSHYPVEILDSEFNVHGHIHNSQLDSNFNKNNHLCASVELTDYKPIDLKELLTKNIN